MEPSPLEQLETIKRAIKALNKELQGDNNHKAVCYVEIALNHLRLAEYEVEDFYIRGDDPYSSI